MFLFDHSNHLGTRTTSEPEGGSVWERPGNPFREVRWMSHFHAKMRENHQTTPYFGVSRQFSIRLTMASTVLRHFAEITLTLFMFLLECANRNPK